MASFAVAEEAPRAMAEMERFFLLMSGKISERTESEIVATLLHPDGFEVCVRAEHQVLDVGGKVVIERLSGDVILLEIVCAACQKYDMGRNESIQTFFVGQMLPKLVLTYEYPEYAPPFLRLDEGGMKRKATECQCN